MIYQGEQYGHSTDTNKLFRLSRPLWVFFLGFIAFYNGNELASIAVDDKGIVQFDHKLLRFFLFI